MAGRIGQWTARLTGFSTPLFGASWQAPTAERDVAAQLLARLEDRRVLYSPSEAEVPHHCAQSVIDIRRMLSDALATLGGKGVLADHIRAMGSASRRFLDRIGSDYNAMREGGHYLSWEFLDALGQMRALFGVHLAMIAARYDLDVQGTLRDIIPAECMADDLDERRDHR
jgi:hypothetical protein